MNIPDTATITGHVIAELNRLLSEGATRILITAEGFVTRLGPHTPLPAPKVPGKVPA